MIAALIGADPTNLTPRRLFLAIAQRGGYLNRKHDARPGWKTLRRGSYDITQMVRDVDLLQSHSPQKRSG